MGVSYRDFIYMDVERIKSIIAQLNKGMIETISKTEKNSDGDKIHASAQFLSFFKAGAENTVLWENQTTESHTMHDYLYEIAESSLEREQLLIKIPGDFNKGNLESPVENFVDLTSTSFVLIKGRSLINDYTYFYSILDNFDKIDKAMKFNSKDKVTSKPHSSVKKNEENLPKAQREAILTILNNFFKDRITFKIIPFKEHIDFRFVGNLDSSFLRERIDNIIYKYGTSPSEEWNLLAQIASIPKKETEPLDKFTSKNELELALEAVFEALREVEKSGLTITFPEIAVTPIAIYR